MPRACGRSGSCRCRGWCVAGEGVGLNQEAGSGQDHPRCGGRQTEPKKLSVIGQQGNGGEHHRHVQGNFRILESVVSMSGQFRGLPIRLRLHQDLGVLGFILRVLRLELAFLGSQQSALRIAGIARQFTVNPADLQLIEVAAPPLRLIPSEPIRSSRLTIG